MLKMHLLAESEGIVVEYHDFVPPLEAVYLVLENGVPIIGLASWLREGTPYARCVFAHELGHHFTAACLPDVYIREHSDDVAIWKAEHKADRWAANYLIPRMELLRVLPRASSVYELAQHFHVTEGMMRFRLSLPDVREGTS